MSSSSTAPQLRPYSMGKVVRYARFLSGGTELDRGPRLQAEAARSILVGMDLTPDKPCPTRDAASLTPRERLERFAALQRRAAQLLAASPEGHRRYWERNLRQRSIDAKF